VYTLHLWPPLGHAAHYTGTASERRLPRRLTDHALGRGARLTQVQVERGGFWVLAQTQPGDRATERRLKQHGATRRCEVCKAVEGYRAGELTAQEALSRAGWDRSNEVQRSVLLDIFGIPEPPEAAAGQPSPVPQPRVPASRPEPQPAPADPGIGAVADALIDSWRSPEAEAGPRAQAAWLGTQAAQPGPPAARPGNVPQRELELGA
jgi:hypothetical protein